MKTLVFAIVLSATTALGGSPRSLDNIFIARTKPAPKAVVPPSNHQGEPKQFKSNDNQQHHAG